MSSIFEAEATPETETTTRGRWRIALAVVVLVLLGATAFGWWWWTRTPQYALGQVVKAYEQHDLETFQEYVDVERLSSSFVDQMLQTVFEEKESAESDPGWAEGLAQGMAMMMRPQLVKGVTDAITRGVESGDFASDEKGGEQVSELKRYFIGADEDRSGVRGIKSIKRQGKIAIAQLEVYDKDFKKSAFLDIKLRDVGDHWQVTELSNFAEFMKVQQKHEKEYVEQLNKPIRKRLAASLRFDDTSAWINSDRWGFSNSILVRTRFANPTDTNIEEFDADIKVLDRNGMIVRTLKITHDEPLLSHSSSAKDYNKDLNQFVEEDKILYRAVSEVGRVVPEVTRIKFEDGAEIKLIRSRSELVPPKNG